MSILVFGTRSGIIEKILKIKIVDESINDNFYLKLFFIYLIVWVPQHWI